MKKWCVYDTYSGEFDFFNSYDEAFAEYNNAVSVIEADAKETEEAYIFQVIEKELIIK